MKSTMRSFWHWRPGRHRRLPIVATLAVFGLTALTAGTGAGVIGAAPALAASSPVTICEISAQSGAALGVGLGDKRGITAYVKWINGHGGVLGHQYKLDALDDASTPTSFSVPARPTITWPPSL
jgi:ABC-type branched-subunit amino acid transport system substrate-binding protein